MTSVRHVPMAAAIPAPGLSRRRYLGLAAAGLASPWLLQACGGGSGGPSWHAAPTEPKPEAEPESVRWCREAISTALGRSDSQTAAVSVALLAGDSVVWREAFGYANRPRKLLATPDTRFNVASISKVVTALAVMILQGRGQLALDQPLAELLPAFRMRSDGYARITVRHLLSHASGVPGNNYRNGSNPVPYPDYAQETMAAVAQSRLKHEPGDMAMYCNDGFTLVEPLVRQLTGLSFPTFVEREIFTPLGMSHTGYALAPAAEGSFAQAHKNGEALPQELPANYATGGVVSTPTDLMKLARLFLDEGVYEGRRIVSAEAVREMGRDQRAHTRVIPDPASSLWRWGLGWDSVQQPALDASGVRAWNKGGAYEFYGTQLFVLPEARLAMLITGSGLDYDPTALAEGLMVRVAAERGARSAAPIASAVPAPVLSAPKPALLEGVYANFSAPLQVRAAADGSLTLQRWEAPWVVVQSQLRARADGYWWADGQTSICYRFHTVGGHRYLSQRTLASHSLYWAEEPIGEWLPPLGTPLPAAWQQRLGSRWQRVNDLKDSLPGATPWVWGLGELAELPGYILLDDGQVLRVIDEAQAGMTVQIPVIVGRDLMEVNMVRVDGQEELHAGGMVFRRLQA
ncbi:MAG: class A beta-lactamase-related serine hydrolase [Comamonadaceae bacterium]|nr:MAG: class A beta-lactamase-related serine hydrolase [Comamonadaceae bacterium]